MCETSRRGFLGLLGGTIGAICVGVHWAQPKKDLPIFFEIRYRLDCGQWEAWSGRVGYESEICFYGHEVSIAWFRYSVDADRFEGPDKLPPIKLVSTENPAEAGLYVRV